MADETQNGQNQNPPPQQRGGNDPIERLNKMLSGDVMRGRFPPADSNVGSLFDQAKKAVLRKKEEENLAAVTKLFEEAFNIVAEKKKIDSEYAGKSKKIDKTLGKLVSKLEAVANGQSLASIAQKEAEDAEKKEPAND